MTKKMSVGNNVVEVSDAELDLILACRSKFKKCDSCVDGVRVYVESLEAGGYLTANNIGAGEAHGGEEVSR